MFLFFSTFVVRSFLSELRCRGFLLVFCSFLFERRWGKCFVELAWLTTFLFNVGLACSRSFLLELNSRSFMFGCRSFLFDRRWRKYFVELAWLIYWACTVFYWSCAVGFSCWAFAVCCMSGGAGSALFGSRACAVFFCWSWTFEASCWAFVVFVGMVVVGANFVELARLNVFVSELRFRGLLLGCCGFLFERRKGKCFVELARLIIVLCRVGWA